MAKKYNNNKEFLIIEMSFDEANLLCNFGCQTSDDKTIIVCDNCNSKFSEDENVYYFAALNRAFCKECCDDLIENLNEEDDDIAYEVKHYNYYANKLNLELIK